jgi:hypothetical protein
MKPEGAVSGDLFIARAISGHHVADVAAEAEAGAARVVEGSGSSARVGRPGSSGGCGGSGGGGDRSDDGGGGSGGGGHRERRERWWRAAGVAPEPEESREQRFCDWSVKNC